ncbi:MAG: flagellar motor switch protein FliG [Pseudomonadota bacterium]
MAGRPGMSEELTGPKRAAVLLMSIGEEAASRILKHIDSKEVQLVSQAIGELEKVSWQNVQEVNTGFQEEVAEETAFRIKAPDFTRKMLTDSLGEEQANVVLDRIGNNGRSARIEALRWIDPKDLADMIKLENPQVIATVLALIDPEDCGEVVSELDPEIAKEAVGRIARIKEVPPSAMAHLKDMLDEKGLATSGGMGSAIELKGINHAADIINSVDSELEEMLMESLREDDADLAEQVENLLFVFENLNSLDDRGFQKLLREVPQDLMIPALKGVAPALRERFFGNMSKRAAEMLRDDLEVSGPMKVSDVEVAQKEILTVAMRLADEGTINLGGKGAEEYV